MKNSTQAERCDICHQSDQFDAANNYCARCAGLAAHLQTAKKELPIKAQSTLSIWQTLLVISTFFVGLGGGFLLSSIVCSLAFVFLAAMVRLIDLTPYISSILIGLLTMGGGILVIFGTIYTGHTLAFKLKTYFQRSNSQRSQNL